MNLRFLNPEIRHGRPPATSDNSDDTSHLFKRHVFLVSPSFSPVSRVRPSSLCSSFDNVVGALSTVPVTVRCLFFLTYVLHTLLVGRAPNHWSVVGRNDWTDTQCLLLPTLRETFDVSWNRPTVPTKTGLVLYVGERRRDRVETTNENGHSFPLSPPLFVSVIHGFEYNYVVIPTFTLEDPQSFKACSPKVPLGRCDEETGKPGTKGTIYTRVAYNIQ